MLERLKARGASEQVRLAVPTVRGRAVTQPQGKSDDRSLGQYSWAGPCSHWLAGPLGPLCGLSAKGLYPLTTPLTL